MFKEEAPFLMKKTSAMKSEIHFSREAIKVLRAKILNENSIIRGSWSSEKLLMIQNYTDNANGGVPLTVENA